MSHKRSDTEFLEKYVSWIKYYKLLEKIYNVYMYQRFIYIHISFCTPCNILGKNYKLYRIQSNIYVSNLYGF